MSGLRVCPRASTRSQSSITTCPSSGSICPATRSLISGRTDPRPAQDDEPRRHRSHVPVPGPAPSPSESPLAKNHRTGHQANIGFWITKASRNLCIDVIASITPNPSEVSVPLLLILNKKRIDQFPGGMPSSAKSGNEDLFSLNSSAQNSVANR